MSLVSEYRIMYRNIHANCQLLNIWFLKTKSAEIFTIRIRCFLSPPDANKGIVVPEKASRTVTPRAIFSPESGGRQNTSTVSVDIIMQGKTMLYLREEG